MSFAAMFSCVLLVVIIGLLFVIANLREQRERVAQLLDEARLDYGAEIARSKRMALRLVEGVGPRGSECGMSLCSSHAHLVGKFPVACPACLFELKRASAGWPTLLRTATAADALAVRAQRFFDDDSLGYDEAIRLLSELADLRGRV